MQDIQNVLVGFKCDNHSEKYVGHKQHKSNSLIQSSSMSLSMYSINNLGQNNTFDSMSTRANDPDVWPPSEVNKQ